MGSFQEMAPEIREVNIANGWDVPNKEDWSGSDDYKIPAKLALIHSEASEALEAFRNRDIENFAEELADATIRIIDLAYGIEIDLDSAIRAKIEKNRARAYRHGGKRL